MIFDENIIHDDYLCQIAIFALDDMAKRSSLNYGYPGWAEIWKLDIQSFDGCFDDYIDKCPGNCLGYIEQALQDWIPDDNKYINGRNEALAKCKNLLDYTDSD